MTNLWTGCVIWWYASILAYKFRKIRTSFLLCFTLVFLAIINWYLSLALVQSKYCLAVAVIYDQNKHIQFVQAQIQYGKTKANLPDKKKNFLVSINIYLKTMNLGTICEKWNTDTDHTDNNWPYQLTAYLFKLLNINIQY